jgi:predicted  nucleic acid-binding Zn-ribbon protein
MGSMASGIEDLHDSSGPAFGQLETLNEVEGRASPHPEPLHEQTRGMLHTPKPTKTAALAAPTDTVIARHVRDVQVPESLAKEYKNRGGFLTPARPGTSDTAGFGTSTASRHGRSLTLKEQSSTIERLSKENFDLKLKVMFLSDRLDKLSEEGIKEMISENVELKTGLAVLQRDNKVLRRRVKELEKQLKDEEDRPGTARSAQSDDEQSAAYDQEAQEREEELIYLREQLEEYVTEVERLRNENLNKEADKRRMAEVMRTLGEKTGERLGEDFERQEEADVWKDLLEQETARREQGDEDNRRLRDEVFRLKQELAAQSAVGPMHHTTNIYNITKKSRERALSAARSGASASVSGDPDANGAISVGSTLVDDLRRESEQLRHENAELRREVGAQTSMLTSRNREKERLYQEIEDLKMAQRRGVPAPSTIDSLLERSASRAGVHERSQSRASGGTRVTSTAVDDADLEELENRMADLRDKNNDLKLQNQDLQRELDACMEDFEAAVEAKKQAEELVAALQEDLETAMNDLMALQAERDEALQEHSNLENEFEALRKEAQEEIDALEGEADQRTAEMERLQLDLNDRTENFDALQAEMRKMSEGLVRLEDEQEAKLRRIQELEQELGDANKDLEELEAKLLEANDKANRLSVQQESSQGEIAFLREEQETDKIRIGDLEAAFANAEQSLRDEKERARELEQRLAAERRQREIVANREKEEVQQFVNELNKEASTAKDEARRLRKSLTSREVEATEWKERLIELENNLREALGDLNGTRSSLLKVFPFDSCDFSKMLTS